MKEQVRVFAKTKYFLISATVCTTVLTLCVLRVPAEELMPRGRFYVLLSAAFSALLWSLISTLVFGALKVSSDKLRISFSLLIFIHPFIWIMACLSLLEFSDESLRPFGLVLLVALFFLAFRIRNWRTILSVALLNVAALIGHLIMLYAILACAKDL